MGSSASKYAESDSEEFNEKAQPVANDDLSVHLQRMSLDVTNLLSEIEVSSLKRWESKLKAEPKNKAIQNALAKSPIQTIAAKTNSELSLRDRYIFNVEVDTVGSPAFLNNQKSSGRCWIFATSNVLRTHVIKNYKLDPATFQLSQSYLFFYDKLEKANYFLHNIIDTADEELDSRLIQWLFSAPVNDGGQWDMIVNVIEKYGVVPNEVFPDNAQAVSTLHLNYVLLDKLREYALVLRELKAQNKSKQEILAVKNGFTNEVYEIIALSLGSPPAPTDSFTWEFRDKNGKFFSFETSPKDFYETYVRYDVSKRFSLIHDPRNDYNTLYTVDRLNNVYEGKPIEYVNLELPVIKKAAIAMLKNNEPVFFGSDVGKYINQQTGVLDTEAYDYELVFNTGLKLTKEQRLRTGSSLMTHAMVITAVHLDTKSGEPVRWKIENSWGEGVGDKGYFVMTDAWFDEFVLQIVTSKAYVERPVYDLWKKKQYKVLPFYDPMGALA